MRRPHPQGRETGRPAGAGADQVPAGDQPEDRSGAWPRGAGDAAGARRRGLRVMRRRAVITLLGGAAAAPVFLRSRVASAQPTDRTRFVGVILNYAENDPEGSLRLAALRDALH